MMRTIVRQKASKLVMKTHLCKKHLEFQATSFSRTILSYPEVFTFYRSHCSCTWLALRSRQSAVKRETNIHYYQEQEQVGRTRCDRLTPRTTVSEKEKKSNNNSCQASLGTSSHLHWFASGWCDYILLLQNFKADFDVNRCRWKPPDDMARRLGQASMQDPFAGMEGLVVCGATVQSLGQGR